MKIFYLTFMLHLIYLVNSVELKSQIQDNNKKRIVRTIPAGSMGGFFTFSEVVRELDSMRTLHPNIISVKDSIFYTLPLPTHLIYLRKPIWMVKISDNPDIDENEPKILLLSLIHSNEPLGMMQMIYFMWDLLNSYQNNTDVQFLINTREIYFIPVLNPDGHIYNQNKNPNGGGSWRLNRQPSWHEGGAVIGIDINKSFSYAWVGDNIDQPIFHIYFRSWDPFFAHESYAILKLCQEKNFTLNANYHVIGKIRTLNGQIIYPWNYLPNALTPDSNQFKYLAKKIIENDRFRHGTTYKFNFEINPTMPQSKPSGTIEDWMYGVKNVKSVTVAIAQPSWPKKDSVPFLAQRLIPLSYRIAWAGGVYPEINAIEYKNSNNESFIRPGETGQMTVSIENAGLYPERLPVQLNISTDDTSVIIHNSISQLDSLPVQQIMSNFNNPFQFTVKQATSIGHKVLFTLQIRINNDNLYKTIEFITGKPALLYGDTVNNLSIWNSDNPWSIIPEHQGRTNVITESSSGVYQNNMQYKLINKTPISFVNIREPWLEFYSRWDIEPDFDFATLSVSTNRGLNWINLRSKRTKFSSGEVPVQSDLELFGYDGFQEDWVQERFSLKQFEECDSVYVKFELSTDGWLVHDGWYLDEIRIMGYPYIPNFKQPIDKLFKLGINYPNPFNPSTSIRFSILKPAEVSITIYNVLGQEVKRLVSKKHYEPGNHSIEWNGRNKHSQAVASGVYFYRVEAGGFSQTKKMLLIR